MDNPTSSNNETRWVEDRIARLEPPRGWQADAQQALQRVNQKRALPPDSRCLRLSMAGAIFAATIGVLLLLPWHTLWISRAGTASVEVGEAVVPPTPPKESAIIPATKTTQPGSAAPEAHPVTRPVAPTAAMKRETSKITPPIAERQAAPASQSDVTQPVVIAKVQPQYTQEARDAKIQGTIELLCVIQSDGSVKVDSIRRSLGYGLDESASSAVEQWRFEPGKKNGVPVSVYVTLTVNFSLK